VISVWVLARWLHIMAAITWIGGMLFILMILLPVVRPVLAADDRALLVGKIGTRYGVVSFIALIILLITGYFNGERRNVVWSDLTATNYGSRLLIKLVLVVVITAITLIHAWYGRRIVAMAELPDTEKVLPENVSRRRQLHVVSGSLSAINLALNLAVVWIAASLAA
jgi:putative copper resistance protein D